MYNKPKSSDYLEQNFRHILQSLASDDLHNPLFLTVKDPANSSNILSSLLTYKDKKEIINRAKLHSNTLMSEIFQKEYGYSSAFQLANNL